MINVNYEVTDKMEVPNEPVSIEPTEEKPKPKRKQRNPSEWKREKRKRSIIAGESHISVKGELVMPKKIGSDCNCKLKCYQKVDESTRQRLFKGYYSLKTYDEQNAYLFGLIKKQDVKRKKNLESDRRTCTYKYHVRDQGKEIQVCKLAFAHIHAVSFRKIRTLSEKLDQNILFPRDGRGRHNNRPTKVSREKMEHIKNHIFQVMKSPELRNFLKEDKNKQMTPELNVAKLHNHYLQLYEPQAINPATGQPIPGYTPKVKNWLYRKVFNDEIKSKDFQTLKRRLDVFNEPLPQKPNITANGEQMNKDKEEERNAKKSRRKGTAKKLTVPDNTTWGYIDTSVAKAAETLNNMSQQKMMPQSCSNVMHFPIVPTYNHQMPQNIQIQTQRTMNEVVKHHPQMQHQTHHHLAQNMNHHHQPHSDPIHQHTMQDFTNTHHNFLNARPKEPTGPPSRMTIIPHTLNPQSLGAITHHHSVATFGGGMGDHLSLQRVRNTLQGQHYTTGIMHTPNDGNQQLDLSVNELANAFYT